MTYIFFRFLVLNQEQTNSGFHRKVPTSVTNNGWTQIFHEIYAITQVRNMCKIFSLMPSKNPPTRENWDKLSVYFSIFLWLNLQLYQKKPFANWQFGKIGFLVNLIIQKWKSKHLVCLSFLWWQVLLRERGKIFYTYSGPLVALQYCWGINLYL